MKTTTQQTPAIMTTRDELASLLLETESKGTTFISFVALTTPGMNKRGNPFWGKVTKRAYQNAQIGAIYENSVNSQRGREDKPQDFQSQGRSYGEGVSNEHKKTPAPSRVIMQHETTGQLYMVVHILATYQTEYLWADTGETLTPEETLTLKTFLKKPKPSPSQSLEKQIKYCNYKWEGIQEITLKGIRYIVKE